MDHKEARRARAHSQGVHGRPRFGDTVEVVRHLVGVQAQDTRAAALAVRARTSGLTMADVTATVADRACVVTWSLRGTRHLHVADDVRPLLALLGGRYARPTRREAELGIDGPVGEAAAMALRAALEGGPMTRPQIKELLEPLGVAPDGQAAIHVIRRAALEGVLCVLPGDEERYVLLDDAVPFRDRIDPEDVGVGLARRHLAASGPATPEDLAAWAGLPLGAARRAWRALDDELVDAGHPGRPAWLLRHDEPAARSAARRPAGCRLLGGFDSLLLAHAERDLHVPTARVRAVNTGGGMVRPVAVVDGGVVGTWRLGGRPPARAVDLRPFDDLAPYQDALGREAADVGRFLDGAPAGLTVARADAG
jgi:hypothetical protein